MYTLLVFKEKLIEQVFNFKNVFFLLKNSVFNIILGKKHRPFFSERIVFSLLGYKRPPRNYFFLIIIQSFYRKMFKFLWFFYYN